nr:hypothetical protein [Pedobacter sp. ASV2]
MAEDYKKIVFDTYKEKKAKKDLPPYLLDPTPGNLREQCLIVCRDKYTSDDHEMLRLFFSDGNKEKGYIKSIENSRAQKFKQMSKILKGADIKNPGIKYFELLEWLMDLNLGTSTAYYKRNYEKAKQKEVEEIIADPEEKIEEIETVDKETVPEGVQDDLPQGRTLDDNNSGDTGNTGPELKEKSTFTPPGKEPTTVIKPPKKIPIVIITFGVAIIIFISTCLTQFWKDKSKRLFNVNPLISINTCMYWTGDHYEQIKCDQKGIAVLKIPFNKYVFENFEKITLPDTLTSNSLGKVWYSKQNNKVDFYTDSAAHPTDDNRRLLPLTQYMLNKNVSYKRYVLNIIYWSIGITFFIVLFGGGAIYLGIVIRKWKQNKAAK